MRNKRIKKKKAKISYPRFLIILLVVFFFYGIHSFHKYMEPRLEALAKQHISFAINNIAKHVLQDMEYDSNSFILPSFDEEGNMVSINYDSYKLNQILYTALNTIDESLLAAQDGKEDPVTHEVFFENGIFYRVPLGSLTGIPFFSDAGPELPVKMQLLNDVTGKVDVSSKSYGINNTMIEVSLVVSVKAQAITMLSVSELQTETKIPLVMQLVNGKVPSILPYGLKEGT